jgi:hypothetical protein
MVTASKKRGYRVISKDLEVYPLTLPLIVDDIESLEFHYKKEKEVKSLLEASLKDLRDYKALEEIKSLTFKVLNLEQGSSDWLEVRHGLATGSNLPIDNKGNLIPTINKYVSKKALEVFQNEIECVELKQEIKQALYIPYTKAMERGHILEPLAKEEYVKYREAQGDLVEVEEIGFVKSDTLPFGASPDGVAIDLLTFERVNLEIKTTNIANFTSYLIDPQSFIDNHYKQIQIEMLVTQTDKTHLICYYPDFDLIVQEVSIDYEFIYNFIQSMKKYSELLETALNGLRKAYKGK